MVTIKNVKEELTKHLGDEVTIKYNLGRNKYENYFKCKQNNNL